MGCPTGGVQEGAIMCVCVVFEITTLYPSTTARFLATIVYVASYPNHVENNVPEMSNVCTNIHNNGGKSARWIKTPESSKQRKIKETK